MVGVVIVVGAFIAVMGTLWLQGISLGRDQVTIEALLRDVGQLMEGNAVKLRGVNIGSVEAIKVAPDGEAVRIRMSIDRTVRLPDDAVVLLAMESMFGDWQAEILSRDRFPWLDYWETDEPGVLGGYALPDISRLTATADRISESLAVLTERVELAFSEETALNIRDAIDNIQEVSQQLTTLVSQQAESFEQLADGFLEAASQVEAAADAARGAFEQTEQYLAGGGQVDSLLTDTRAAAANLRELAGTMSVAANNALGTLDRADSTFARFDRLTTRIEAGEGALGRLMSDTALVTRAETALEQLSLLLTDFRENPRRYVRLSIF